MSMKLPCDMIRDLLPSYIDGLESDVTKEAVEEHLSECTACSEICESMKNDDQDRTPSKTQTDVSDDKVLFHKIKKKVNRKVKIAVIAGAAALLLAVLVFELSFNVVIKEVPRQDVEVTATVYPMKDIATLDETDAAAYGVSFDEDQMVVIKTGDETPGDDEQCLTLTIPDYPNSEITVTKDLMDTYDTMTLIKWKSPYFLRSILWDIKEVDGKRIMYIEHYRTTLFNNQEVNSGSYTTSIDFGTLDQIIYQEKDGSETVLWENK